MQFSYSFCFIILICKELIYEILLLRATRKGVMYSENKTCVGECFLYFLMVKLVSGKSMLFYIF